MVSGALIVIGFFVFATALLEIFLSERRKAAITDGLIHVWDWLDEMRKPAFGLWQRPRPRRILVGLPVLLGLLFAFGALHHTLTFGPLLGVKLIFDDPLGLSDTKYSRLLRWALLAPLPMLGILVGVGAGLWMVRQIAKAPTYTQPTILLAIVAGVISLRLLGITYPTPIQRSLTVTPDLLPLVVIIFIIVPFSMVFLYMWFVVVVPMTFAMLAAGALAVLEFVVRRIIEYPKGPVITLGAIFAATGTFLRLVPS